MYPQVGFFSPQSQKRRSVPEVDFFLTHLPPSKKDTTKKGQANKRQRKKGKKGKKRKKENKRKKKKG